MFVDINELKPGGLEKFQTQLAESLIEPQVNILAGSSAVSSSLPMMPQRAYVAGSSSGGNSNISPLPDQTGPRQRPGDI